MTKKKLAIGSLFEIPAPDGRSGYGQILVPGKLLYVVIFERLYRGGPPPCNELTRAALLIGWTMDALIYHGRWKIVGTCPIPSGLPFPNYKLNIGSDIVITDYTGKVLRVARDDEANSLNFRSVVSPIVFQDSLLAHHGMSNLQMLDKLSVEQVRRQCIVPCRISGDGK